MNIRPYRHDDNASIHRIYDLSKLDELVLEKQSFTLLPLAQDKPRNASLFESDIYVVEENGIIAFGAWFQHEIRALFVHPEQRGKGVGDRLLQHLISLSNAETVLFVAKSNAPAIRLYQKYGFEVDDEFLTKYNGKNVIANRMRLSR